MTPKAAVTFLTFFCYITVSTVSSDKLIRIYNEFIDHLSEKVQQNQSFLCRNKGTSRSKIFYSRKVSPLNICS